MKDLYRRNQLKPLESDVVKINNSHSDNPEDGEAAFAILLNSDRKKEYDKVYKAVTTIGQLRAHFGINNLNGWRHSYTDFAFDKIEEKIDETSEIDDKVDNLTVNPKKHVSRTMMFGGAAMVLVMVLLFFVDESEQADARNFVEDQIVLMHAVADQIPIYMAEDINSPQIGMLNQFGDINVNFSRNSNDWYSVTIRDQVGYVKKQLLQEGSGENAHVEYCQQLGVANLEHGNRLLVTDTGTHTLIVMNPPGDDAVVKLKGENRHEVLSYFLKGGQSITLDNVPQGDFEFVYATGRNFSLPCGRFLENMKTWRANRKFHFDYEDHGEKQYSKTISYTLKSPLGSDTAISAQSF